MRKTSQLGAPADYYRLPRAHARGRTMDADLNTADVPMETVAALLFFDTAADHPAPLAELGNIEMVPEDGVYRPTLISQAMLQITLTSEDVGSDDITQPMQLRRVFVREFSLLNLKA